MNLWTETRKSPDIPPINNPRLKETQNNYKQNLFMIILCLFMDSLCVIVVISGSFWVSFLFFWLAFWTLCTSFCHFEAVSDQFVSFWLFCISLWCFWVFFCSVIFLQPFCLSLWSICVFWPNSTTFQQETFTLYREALPPLPPENLGLFNNHNPFIDITDK